MKTGRYIAEAVFLLTAVFCCVRSTNSLNETQKPWLKLVPEDEELTIPSNDPFFIYCYLYSSDAPDSARMEWIDPKGNIIPEGFRTSFHTLVKKYPGFSGLMLFDPRIRDSGQYTCSAEYNDTSDPGTIARIEASVNITVLDKPRISRFQNVTAEEGKRAGFACSALSKPTPNITIWKADDPDFAENETGRVEIRHSPLTDRNDVTVTFNPVKRSDEGLYYCIAEANGFYSNETAYLEVQFAPNLTATPRKQMLSTSGHFTNLTCIAEANPPAAITWEFQNPTIDPENQHNVTYGHTVISTLLIYINDTSDIHSNVYGIFTCTARNHLGSRSVDITLQTVPEYDVPGQISQVIIDRVTPRSIFFRFLGPHDDGGKPIIAYVANYSTPEDYYHSVIEWPRGSTYVVRNLRPGAHYTFSVAARNEIGIGSWKSIDYLMPKEINDTTIEPNTLITKNVNITDYPDRYEIRWKVHDDYGALKRFFIVTYFDDGRVKVDHQNGNTTFPF